MKSSDLLSSVFSNSDTLLFFVFCGRDYPIPGVSVSVRECVERLVRNFLICVCKRLSLLAFPNKLS